MKISILVHDLSSNSLVRMYPIAKVLERHYQIEVIGPVLGKEIFKPYQDEFYYKPVLPNYGPSKRSKTKKGISVIEEVINNISGDVIYVFKPRITSFGIALLAKYRKSIPLVLDIEDWEAVHYYHTSFRDKLASIKRFYILDNMIYHRLMELLTKLANEITVVSSFLQKRFGGIKLPHGADCNFFEPSKYNRENLREEYDLNDKYIILFAGTPRPHKGIEELIKALEILSVNTIRLLVVGYQTEYLTKLMEKHGAVLMYAGSRPHSDMPKFLSLADLIVLPQRNTPFAQAQVPGKVFEAMAMAKPIIATNVSDLPEILGGCGWIVEPENPKQLSEIIQYIYEHRSKAKERGKKAREKCKREYSWDVMEKKLIAIFDKYKTD